MFHVGRFRMGEELYVESEYSETVQNLLISTMTSELIDKYRFDRQSIMMICDMLQDDLESNTFRNRALTSNMKVFVALRFYASGSFQGVIAVTFGLSQPSVSRAISDVSTALVKRAGNYITFPKEPKLSEIKGNFYSVANFPGVIGLVDGTHIRIQVPGIRPRRPVCQ